ncbi:hypothetical protein BP5796_01311 [Coleophoma crateriformis]|uniref:Cytochrome P450 n=1 Tax=Coleophoma crateriformis TaxID=565419 RepID=A0A3D8T017_9HELO|nr:hypothetical protein BP5796_01311 [Coleophoma crateriformis]
MSVFSWRIYVVTSPELVQAIHRNTKAFSFDPIFINVSQRLFKLDKATLKLMMPHPQGSPNQYDYIHSLESAMSSALIRGPNLENMKHRALDRFCSLLENISAEEQSVNLFSWIGDRFADATATALWGPDNPISKDHSLIQRLWDFQADISLLSVAIFPSIIARKGHEGQQRLDKAFQDYYQGGHFTSASLFIQNRINSYLAQGISLDQIPNCEGAILGAGTMNSVPALFWLICFILVDEKLHVALREELSSITTRIGAQTVCLNTSELGRTCPLFTSTFHEVLRFTNAEVGNRIVMEDTLLEGRWLLKKDAVVQTPSIRRHMSREIWGPDFATFNPRRFMDRKSQPKDVQKQQWQGGFTPFGGGRNLCPGRHFATAEILGVATILLTGFEFTSKDGGVFKMPRMCKQGLAQQVKQPSKDVEVLIKRRREFEGFKWTFDVGPGTDAEYLAY